MTKFRATGSMSTGEANNRIFNMDSTVWCVFVFEAQAICINNRVKKPEPTLFHAFIYIYLVAIVLVVSCANLANGFEITCPTSTHHSFDDGKTHTIRINWNVRF